jgi:hypothetical protein
VTTSSPALDRRRTAAFAGIGVATHGLAIALAFIVARVSQAAEGLSDLGRALSTFFVTEIVAGLVCLIGGGVLFRVGRREVGLGLLSGWVVGLVLTVVFLSVIR